MKKVLFWISVSLLVLLLVFLTVLLFQGVSELDELTEKGENIMSDNSNKNEENTDIPDNTPDDTPTSTPTDPPEDEDPFDAVDTSNAASQSAFHVKVGSKDGMTADVITGEAFGQVKFLHDGLTVYGSGTMQFNNTTPGWFYEVGEFSGEDAVFSHRLYYRLFKDGEWESSVHVVDGTNFVLYLSSSYDNGSTYDMYERCDESFSVSNPHVICSVAIGLAENFTVDFEGFRLYALME